MTETMVLRRPAETDLEELLLYKKETEGDSSGSDSLPGIENLREWLAEGELEEIRDGETKIVPSSQLLYVREEDGRVVGMVHIRHELNDFLLKYGGNIGYSVRPSERRKGYAAKMLEAALSYCRFLGMERILITCTRDNEGSRRVILKSGGKMENTVRDPDTGKVLERYWITL